jgi:2-furoyl-CoA dehydrogenase FAD binding subunit
VKPAPFDYVRPQTLHDALAALRQEDAKVLAGGQSLVPALNMRLVRPSLIIDVNGLSGMNEIVVDDGRVRIGALVRQRTLEGSPVAREALPLVAEALPHVGHVVTRNRGTVGGSLVHADAAAELPLCLLVLGGSAVVMSTNGQREIAAEDLFVTYFTTSLAPEELLIASSWPVLGGGWGFAFEELSQRRGDYGLSIAAAALRVEDGKLAEARLGLGSVVDRPTIVETGLEGEQLSEELAAEAGRGAAADLKLYDNLHASVAYQRHLTALLAQRALLRAWRNALEGLT